MKMAVGKEAEWKKLWPMLHYSSNKSKDKKKPSKKLQSILTISECLLWVRLLQTKICDLTSLPVYQFWHFKIFSLLLNLVSSIYYVLTVLYRFFLTKVLCFIVYF